MGGDRGNIAVIQNSKMPLTEGGAVWFYGHWAGSNLPEIVQKALGKRWRWDDSPYLARIVFDVLTEGQTGTETAFGIGTGPGDNQHPYLVVDGGSRIVSVVDYNESNHKPTNELARFTFEQFLTLDLKDKSTLEEFYGC